MLVGGQAVNLWAEVYHARIPALLEPLAPFVSKDCDLHFRSRSQPEQLAREVGWRFVPTEGVGQILGRLHHESGAIIEILACIRTAIADQIEREAVDGALDGLVVHVLNPASMLREKVSLAVEANQTGRQDAKHVQILAPCCLCFFEDLAEAVPARELTGRDLLPQHRARSPAVTKRPPLRRRVGNAVDQCHSVDRAQRNERSGAQSFRPESIAVLTSTCRAEKPK